jgi:putative membrane protein
MRHMLEDHEKDVAKFTLASKFLQDPDIKSWVIKTLPTLNEHLKMAKEIHERIEKTGK